MELRHLRYFEAVADEGHFGRAAKRLRIAQPPLSRQIQALERELGLALFDRSNRRVQLTAAGVVFRAHTRRVLEAVQIGVDAAQRANQGHTGRIVVGYLSSLAYSGITALLKAYRARFPEVELALRELGPQEQISALKELRIDVGFTRAPLDEVALRSECVHTEDIVVALPEDHPLTKRKKVALSSLAQEPFVAFPRERSPAFFDQLMAICRRAGFVPRIAQEAPHLDLLSLVAAGFGIALVPASVRNIPREGMVTRPLVEAPRTDLLVAWRADDRSPALAGFLAVVRKVGLGGRSPPSKAG